MKAENAAEAINTLLTRFFADPSSTIPPTESPNTEKKIDGGMMNNRVDKKY